MSIFDCEREAAQALEAGDPRFNRLLGKILFRPDEVAQSVLKHLGTDTAVWHNTLSFMALKAKEPMAALMVLTADVLREGKAGELFGPRELSDIALQSMSTWLMGGHEDRVNLRLRAVMALAAMLDDPERQDHARKVLSGISSKASIPPTGDTAQQLARNIREEHQEGLQQWARSTVERHAAHEQDPSMAVCLAKAIVEGGVDHYLADAHWLAIARFAQMKGDSTGHMAAMEAMQILAQRFMATAAAHAPGLNPMAAQTGSPKPPRP